MEELIDSDVSLNESKELVVKILINPKLLKESTQSVDYIHSIESLVVKYFHARYPSANGTSDKSPSEIVTEIKKLATNSLRNVRDVDSRDMENFLINLDYIVKYENW